MRDATHHADASQMPQHLIEGTMNVQQHRQRQFAGKRQLIGERRTLNVGLRRIRSAIEPDLTHGDGSGRRQARRQRCRINALARPAWMYAKGRRKHRRCGTAGRQTIEVTMADARHDHTCDTACPRLRQHLVPVGIEIGKIKMRMGVDQHRQRCRRLAKQLSRHRHVSSGIVPACLQATRPDWPSAGQWQPGWP